MAHRDPPGRGAGWALPGMAACCRAPRWAHPPGLGRAVWIAFFDVRERRRVRDCSLDPGRHPAMRDNARGRPKNGRAGKTGTGLFISGRFGNIRSDGQGMLRMSKCTVPIDGTAHVSTFGV